MDKFKKGILAFADLCYLAKDKNMLEELFELFLTAEEKNDLSMRYWIIQELVKEEKPQRQIAEELAVSIAKITRGSNELKRAKRKFLEFLKENMHAKI